MSFAPSVLSCRLCGHTEGNRTFAAQERMLGLHDAFTYLACGTCGALQLLDPPADLARYYPSERYYSYTPHVPRRTWRSRLQDVAMRALMDHRLGHFSPLGAVLAASTDKLRWVRPGLFTRRSAILDVGCGSGALLLLLQRCGFTDLTGADPFIQADIAYPGGLHIRKRELKDVERIFDLILLNHAFVTLPTYPSMTIGEHIMLLRKKKGLSQADLGKAIGTSGDIIGRYEREAMSPSIDVIMRLAEELDVSIDFLVGRSKVQIDKDALDRFEDIATLPEEKRTFLFALIDICLRDFKTRKAYSKT